MSLPVLNTAIYAFFPLSFGYLSKTWCVQNSIFLRISFSQVSVTSLIPTRGMDDFVIITAFQPSPRDTLQCEVFLLCREYSCFSRRKHTLGTAEWVLRSLTEKQRSLSSTVLQSAAIVGNGMLQGESRQMLRFFISESSNSWRAVLSVSIRLKGQLLPYPRMGYVEVPTYLFLDWTITQMQGGGNKS